MPAIPKIPYFQTSRYRVETMVELAEIKHGVLLAGRQKKAADLGSGDGRIVIAFAQQGVEMHGYEIDEELKKLAEETIERLNIKNALIHKTDFWNENLSSYDIICCYPMPTIMGRLERKLQEELKPGSRILLNYFPFKHWKEKKIKDNIYLYVK